MNFFSRLDSFIAFSRPKDQAFLTFFIGLFRILILNENREKNLAFSDFFESFYITKIEFKIRHLTFFLATKWFALLISRALAFSEFSLRITRSLITKIHRLNSKFMNFFVFFLVIS